MDIKISPSILAADFACLGEEVKHMSTAGADMLHIDVMDGHFVPNISFGIPVMESLKSVTDLPMDVHLMITHPANYIKQFVDAGANLITFHVECESDVIECINMIRQLGVKVGISLKPGTPVSELKKYLPMVDMVLVMTVEPGFGGQSFMTDMMDKVRILRDLYPEIDIQVDGGINEATARIVREAGANVLVAGSYLFNAQNVSEAIRNLKGLS